MATILNHTHGEDTIERHLGFANFIGPGTHVYNRIKTGILPISKTDAAAMIHDIEYLWLDQKIADKTAVGNAQGAMKPAMKIAFSLKDLVGYNTDRDQHMYEELRHHVSTNPNYSNLLNKYGVNFTYPVDRLEINKSTSHIIV
jgi:hypothetical protein